MDRLISCKCGGKAELMEEKIEYARSTSLKIECIECGKSVYNTTKRWGFSPHYNHLVYVDKSLSDLLDKWKSLNEV